MEEITELDMTKYLVLKQEDIDAELSPGQKVVLESIKRVIGARRVKRDKPYSSSYVVLNLDDNIDIRVLHRKIENLDEKLNHNPNWQDLKVKDIAVELVNAILKTKE